MPLRPPRRGSLPRRHRSRRSSRTSTNRLQLRPDILQLGQVGRQAVRALLVREPRAVLERRDAPGTKLLRNEGHSRAVELLESFSRAGLHQEAMGVQGTYHEVRLNAPLAEPSEQGPQVVRLESGRAESPAHD